MRLVDADSLIENLSKWMKQVDPTHPSDIPPMDNIIVSTIMTVEEEPTVDPVRHGKWAVPHGHSNARVCSVCMMICHEDNAMFYNYCPNCGARMDGEGDKECLEEA